jgi:hypothetical protein
MRRKCSTPARTPWQSEKINGMKKKGRLAVSLTLCPRLKGPVTSNSKKRWMAPWQIIVCKIADICVS